MIALQVDTDVTWKLLKTSPLAPLLATTVYTQVQITINALQ